MHRNIADRYDTGAIIVVDEYALARDKSADKVRQLVKAGGERRRLEAPPPPSLHGFDEAEA